jgi:hypothetical protein
MRSMHFNTGAFARISVVFIVGVLIGYFFNKTAAKEGFSELVLTGNQTCTSCGSSSCPPVPDLSKYVLKSSIPPPPKCPDMSLYMLKTECPPVPDMSQYVLKSSIPKQEPVIIDNSSCKKDCGECPPCPRPRCPEIKCPPPTVCPACPPCPRQACPETKVKCKAEEVSSSPVRPYLAPLDFGVFGGN